MSVRSRILLALFFVSVVFGGAIWIVRQEQAEYFDRLAETRVAEWRHSVEEFLLHQQRPAASTVVDFSADLKLVLALEYADRAALASILDDGSLKSRGVQAAWIYGPDGQQIFSHVLATAAQALDGQPLPGVDVAALIGREPRPRFHFELPGATAEGAARRFMEIRGAPILGKVEGADGKERVLGYLFAGCILDREEVAAMPLLYAEDHVELVSALAQPPAESIRTMTHSLPLLDWNGRSIGQIVVWNNSRELARIESLGERHLLQLVVAALVLFVVLFGAFSRSIIRPLKLMIRGLDDGDAAALEPLARQRSEFGALARLIRDHIEQSSAFAQETQRREAAQLALRESDEMLRHSQKLEAVGRLAGGVAHDFNNLLTAIIGYSILLEQRLARDDGGREQAELIHQAGEQAAGLTRQLLAFSRKQLLQPRLIDLNSVVRNLHRLLQRIIGEHIEIFTEVHAASACVRADPGQIEQVIVNLGVNARDAMPRGGRLAIRTRDRRIDSAALELDVPPGDYVALEVMDTGEGMDAETRARIFEPFFTTKGPGKGTGLGLATVYGIVRQSGGGIAVESEPGRGTTFCIFLPRQDGVPEAIEAAPPAGERRRCTETVLVVEDEEIVRELVCEVLRAEGYRVTGTDRGGEALRLVREELKSVDLLISDVVMPEMNGAVVARRLHEISPAARVLFVSGYSESDMADQGLEALSFEVLQKPFTPATLAQKVREVLDARP